MDSGMSSAINVFGTVSRLVGSDLAYAVTDEGNPRVVSFGSEIATVFAGETLDELGFAEGAKVALAIEDGSGTVLQATKLADVQAAGRGTGRGSGTTPLPRDLPSPGTTGQIELIPDAPAFEKIKAPRAMPTETRRFGKVLDTRNLRPGDLLLSRDLTPEWTGRAISSVQQDGGYDELDARWTHAAMYVGDGDHVVEATFDSPLKGGSVRLTHLDDYSKGGSALRFRRPKYLATDEVRWKVCVRALSRLHKPYSFGTAIKMWLRVAVQGGGFFDDDHRFAASDAVVCSTLYADAYNEATRRTLGETCGVCVPAWLSVSEDFDDLEIRWLSF
jgi:hypothetical protein